MGIKPTFSAAGKTRANSLGDRIVKQLIMGKRPSLVYLRQDIEAVNHGLWSNLGLWPDGFAVLCVIFVKDPPAPLE